MHSAGVHAVTVRRAASDGGDPRRRRGLRHDVERTGDVASVLLREQGEPGRPHPLLEQTVRLLVVGEKQARHVEHGRRHLAPHRVEETLVRTAGARHDPPQRGLHVALDERVEGPPLHTARLEEVHRRREVAPHRLEPVCRGSAQHGRNRLAREKVAEAARHVGPFDVRTRAEVQPELADGPVVALHAPVIQEPVPHPPMSVTE